MTETPGGPAVEERERFLVPREPRLDWRMLRRSRRPLPVPVEGRPVLHLFSGRNALYHGLRLLNIAPGDTVLVPAYHCAVLVDPVVHYGAQVRFYRIDREARPDIDDLEARIDSTTRAVVAIHYFGFPQPISQLRELCDRRGLRLIEDCAHVLGGSVDGRALGSFGDVAVFSWRKLLPLYDGGQLVVNGGAVLPVLPAVSPSWLYRARVWKNVGDRMIADARSSQLAVLGGVMSGLSGLGRRLAEKGNGDSMALRVNNYALEFETASTDLPMSAPSRRILRNTDLGAVVRARRENYCRLAAALGALPDVVPLQEGLPEGVCPWVFPMAVKGRVDFHRTLRARGVPATTWGGVIHRDLRLEEFPDAAFLYEKLIFLPVHQSLSVEETDRLGALVADAVASRT